jgi:formate hydrogenlyase subunit 6/NADH:ubiquinone oxidoreductase subunit I
MSRIVLKNLLAGPATRRYPYVVRPAFPGSRGRITIDYPQCIHCGACARRCPAKAIVVSRDPKSWRIDNFACVTCGLCVRVCPKKCLFMRDERPASVEFADLAGRVEAHITPPEPPKPDEAAAGDAPSGGAAGA